MVLNIPFDGLVWVNLTLLWKLTLPQLNPGQFHLCKAVLLTRCILN